jgi:hypothetical protein
VRELLEALLARGVLKRGAALENERKSGPRPSPLPAAPATRACTWLDCERLSAELLGQSVELAYLELLVPLHRVAHPALDREGRQVGEANVFPPQLRLDIETQWRSCQYPGSRYQDEFPLNASALRSMQRWWRPVLALMARARDHYVQRYSNAADGFSLLDVHNFSCLLMGLPAYAMMRARQPVRNTALHPALSSLARLADGARMTANELLTGDTLHTPISGRELHDAAERTNLFLSTYGVCAAPRRAIDTFLGQLADGGGPAEPLDDELEALCTELDSALDYGLHALRSYAVSSFAWANVSQTYARLMAMGEPSPRIARDWQRMAAALGTRTQRAEHEKLYDEMWSYSGRGVSADSGGLAQLGRAALPFTESDLTALGVERAQIIIEHLRVEQPLTAAAEASQAQINARLGRPPARAPLRADVLYLGHRLRHPAARLPYVMDALRDELGLRICVTSKDVWSTWGRPDLCTDTNRETST